MNELLSGKTNEAIDNLYSSNPAMGQKIQQLNVMKQQVAMVANLFGKAIGVEDYIVEQITPSITRVVKIMKYDVHPVVWEFYFYKPHDKWVASNSIFNDQFGSLNSKK
jgi:hypothetical protein